MPVGSTTKTSWEERAVSRYLLDPSTGLPVGSLASPFARGLPDMEYLGGTSFSLDGSLPKWLTPSAGASVVEVSARGGEVYYEINAVGGASASSPGYVPDGQTVRIGPVCNMTSMWFFSATAGTMVHVSYWREQGTALPGTWTAPAYWERVMATDPIAYWPLWEASGTIARCLVNPAQNGTYNSDVSTWPVGTGIGDGNTAPGFDGTHDYININTATLRAAFNGSEGTMHIWAKVSGAGVWTDGTARYLFRLSVDANNYATFLRSTVNNRISMIYAAGGTTESVDLNGLATTGWFTLTMTWSKTADEVRYYYNGTWNQTDTVLGNWAGVFANAYIGAANGTPAGPWSGALAHGVIFDRALPDGTIATLSAV